MDKRQERIGKTAHIRYRGGAKGEDVLDDHSQGEPLAVIIGEGSVPKGIENLLYELEVGERREVEIAPEQGYGLPRTDGIQWYPRTLVYRGQELKVGDTLACANPQDNSVLPGRIVATTQDLVQVDVNHPYAGKTLVYWVELVKIT
ncbi:MAG: FKBP-type peptidyl-prolyl cis-trans isomerase [Coriobacteriales bacterium]|jgi:FKBP-type peptidyl-prolyl cis-trans isomerase 2|nr:FKBP-type peptidyl-prolyl cis-trans isomerase [Coriobacteriales bacterium]